MDRACSMWKNKNSTQNFGERSESKKIPRCA